MPQIQVKKVVAICFLEAVKQVLEQVCTFRVELSQQGQPGPADLSNLYGEARRLRDYLQRSVSAYQDLVKLDVSAEDSSLLVACCRRTIDGIDIRLTEPMSGADEKLYLQRKRQVLADWAVELAQKPLLELPLKRIGNATTEGSRALMARMHQKLFGDVSQRTRIVGPSAGHHGIATGVNVFDSLEKAGSEPVRAEVPGEGSSAFAMLPAVVSASFDDPVACEVGQSQPLIVSARVRDPRLRALVAMDLLSHERAVSAADHRLATVLLASIAESAVIDHAIPRRAEFGLTGTPETWDPVELLLRELGEAALPKDRALAFNLFASRNLLRPAVQMVAPAIVTPATLERLQEFVQRVLHVLGVNGQAEPQPAQPGAHPAAHPDS